MSERKGKGAPLKDTPLSPPNTTASAASVVSPTSRPTASASETQKKIQKEAKNVLQRIKERIQLGVILDNGPDSSLKVTQVFPNCPMAIAGILKGDLITSVNNKVITSKGAFKKLVETLSPGDELEFKITRHNDSSVIKKVQLVARGVTPKEIALLRKFAAGREISGVDVERFDKISPRLEQELKLAQQALENLTSESYDSLLALSSVASGLPNHCETIFHVIAYSLGEKNYEWDNIRKALKDCRQFVNRLKKVEVIGIGNGLDDWIYKELKPIILEGFSPDKDKTYNEIERLPATMTVLWQWLLRICQYNKLYGKWWQSTATSDQAPISGVSNQTEDGNSASEDALNDLGKEDVSSSGVDDLKDSKEVWDVSFYEDTHDQTRHPIYDVTKWDTARVVYWLCKLNLSFARYVYDFVENAVDGNMLLNVIDEDTLEHDLQVTNRLHRKNMLNGIIQLKEKMNSQSKIARASGTVTAGSRTK